MVWISKSWMNWQNVYVQCKLLWIKASSLQIYVNKHIFKVFLMYKHYALTGKRQHPRLPKSLYALTNMQSNVTKSEWVVAVFFSIKKQAKLAIFE